MFVDRESSSVAIFICYFFFLFYLAYAILIRPPTHPSLLESSSSRGERHNSGACLDHQSWAAGSSGGDDDSDSDFRVSGGAHTVHCQYYSLSARTSRPGERGRPSFFVSFFSFSFRRKNVAFQSVDAAFRACVIDQRRSSRSSIGGRQRRAILRTVVRCARKGWTTPPPPPPRQPSSHTHSHHHHHYTARRRNALLDIHDAV